MISQSSSTAVLFPRLPARLPVQSLGFSMPHVQDADAVGQRLLQLQSELARRADELAVEVLLEASRVTPPLRLPVSFDGLPLPSFRGGLRRPLDGVLTFEERQFVLEVPELGIVVDSATKEGIVDALGEQVDALASHYLSLEDSQLTPGGKAVKELLKALVVG